MWKVRTSQEIEYMRESNRLLGILHEELKGHLKPGMTTQDLDDIAEGILKRFGVVSNFKNYDGFPANICVSVNDEIVHGIPSKSRVLGEGDIVSIDAGLIYKGYHSDAARTYGVGEISPEAARLIRVTRDSFFAGIRQAVAGNHINDVSRAIGEYAQEHGMGVVKELTGHGIGTALHEKPYIPNYARRLPGVRLRAGYTLAVEPMLTLGRPDIEFAADDSAVITQDGSWAAHYENTILITPDGAPEILSLGPEERKELGL